MAAPEPDPSAPVVPFDPEAGRWSKLEMLIADLIDEIRSLRYVTVAAATGKPGTPPEPYPRPGVSKPARRAGRRSRLTAEQRRALDPRLRVVEEPPEAAGS